MEDKEVVDTNAQQDLKQSVRDFETLIKPHLLRILGGRIYPVEGAKRDYVTDMFDKLAGIDYWYLNDDTGIRGLASRIQIGRNWRTFTVRKARDNQTRTEFEKLQNAIEDDWLHPYWCIQAYIDIKNGFRSLSQFAMARTEDILAMIDKGIYIERKTGKNQIGQSKFCVVKWDDMIDTGYKVYIYP